MAMKFFEKIKDIEVPKVSLYNVFGKNNDENDAESSEIQQGETTETPSVKTEKIVNSNESGTSEEGLQEKVTQYFVENNEKIKKWFSESQIDDKLINVAKKAGATIIYPVLLLYNVFKSPNTSLDNKLLIVAPLAYFVMPTDLIADFLPVVGYTDDGLAIVTCIKSLASSITNEIKEQAKVQCKELMGEIDENVINSISSIVEKNQDAKIDKATEVSNKKSKRT